MHQVCTKCYTPIKDFQCSCRWHFSLDSMPPIAETFHQAFKAFDFWCEQNDCEEPLKGMDFKGNCFIFFKGNEVDLDKVNEYVMNLKKRI